MLKKIITLFLLFIITPVSLPQGDGLIIEDNYRIFPSNTSQTEVFIIVHPSDANFLFATANTLQFSPSFFVSEGVYVSTNSGQTWFGSDTCNGANIFFHGGDPAISIDKDGNLILVRKGTSTFNGAYSHYSNDGGITWSNQKNITNDILERSSIVTDTENSSTYFGRTYSTWALLSPPYAMKFSYTDDITGNWNSISQINNPTVRSSGGDMTLGPNSELYVCWGGVTGTNPITEIQVGFAVSTNGGSNWTVSENAFQMSGIVGILTSKQNIRVNGLPRIAVDLSNTSTNGNIYIVTSQKNLSPAGSDPDIILRKSTDGGQTWSVGIRVNQDALSNGKYQFFPGITVDDLGGINIIFYDDRNTTSDSSGVFLARSTDAGNSWSEYEISDHNFKPTAIGGLGQGYMGDNIDIISVGNKLFPVWMDNSTGTYQIWSVPITIPFVDVEEDNNNLFPKGFELKQNYPNPFNPNTTIEFELPQSTVVSIKIFDVTGKEIVELISDYLIAGPHKVNFNTTKFNLSSGVYFYRLTANGFTETKPMILLK